MANLTIEMPDDLARRLEEVAATQQKTVQEIALERLRSLVETILKSRAGSAASLLRTMNSPPHISASDVEEIEAAIAAG
jgi:predicted transcriptional regulator